MILKYFKNMFQNILKIFIKYSCVSWVLMFLLSRLLYRGKIFELTQKSDNFGFWGP